MSAKNVSSMSVKNLSDPLDYVLEDLKLEYQRSKHGK